MLLGSATPAFSPAGLYGKLPAQGDFARVRASEPAARALALWLEAATEEARRRGVPPLAGPVRFAIQLEQGGRILAGVLAASRDKVGRPYPLAVFRSAEGRALAESFPRVPEALGPFLDAAEGLLAEAATLPAAEVGARLDALPPPAEPGAAEALARAEAASGRALLQRLFGEAGPGQPLYAIHCVRSACQAVRGRPPAQARAVLDCPVREPIDRWAWLELSRRLLGWGTPPSFLWQDGAAPRLLLSAGPPPTSVYGALCGDAAAAGKLWPLTTRSQPALAAAGQALGPAVARALERVEGSVAALLGVAAGEEGTR